MTPPISDDYIYRMKNNPLAQVLNKVRGQICLFESNGEVDDFLKDTIAGLMEQAEAPVGAVYVYDDDSRELVFRVGYDAGDFWDSMRCGGKGAPVRFSVDGNEAGNAFSEGNIRTIDYSDEHTDHPFKSKILIPIYHGPEKIGLLLMVHKIPHAFDNLDRSGILEAAYLLGDRLSEAMVLVNNDKEVEQATDYSKRQVLKGMKTSDGVAEGTALPIWTDMDSAAEKLLPLGSVKEESDRFEKALALSIHQLEEFQNAASSGDSEMVALIFTAQMYMLKDSSFIGKMRTAIEEGKAGPLAVREVINQYADRFSRMQEVRLAEKAQDVRDLGFRLITNMGSTDDSGFSYKGKIVLSRHIYPSDLYRLAIENVSGLVLQGAGVTAHISILARSLDLPVLISDDKKFLSIPEGTRLLLDAGGGKLFVNPFDSDRDKALRRLENQKGDRSHYTLKGQTADEIPVEVFANINILKDAREAVRQGAEGIGLYRSEFPFILKNDFLSEEQQYRIYRSIVNSQTGKQVILRTADIGGDKLLQGRSEAESNPFLGVRGIRFSLANKGMFRDQLKAMLRAGEGADLGIMLPMVSDIEEVLEAKEEIALCCRQLEERGVPFNRNPRIGAMVELPSAAMSVADLAQETDFLSIGTNDLTMYLLAVDRTNENLSHLYRSNHPAVLRVLSTIAKEAGDKVSEISVCGDMAADPHMIPFFVGLGIRKLSVSPAKVETVKQELSRRTLDEMESISQEMLSIRRQGDMEQYIKNL